jgi:4-diphosphocytidyl-2-C-methyl-D-erythritol kinase
VTVTVPSLAKLNLDLRVLHKRPDNFHELRTIFQTVSLGDHLQIEFEKQKRSQVELSSSIDIVDNLVVRAAKLLMEKTKIRGWVRFSLTKHIPMGAGLGGGSSNAASVLAALPAISGVPVPMSELVQMAETLGSDVPFFLRGGTALGVGKGTELYPLPDLPSYPVVIVATGIHVATPDAYRALSRNVSNALTSQSESPILGEFQTIAWALSRQDLGQLPLKNDFEQAVFTQHPEIVRAVRKLGKLGAKPALMTGSGSAVFGVFPDTAHAKAAGKEFPDGTAFPVRFVTRQQYRQLWQKALGTSAKWSCFGVSGPTRRGE